MTKRELRTAVRARLAAMTSEQAATSSAAACARLCQTGEFLTARLVMIFLSTSREPDTAPLAAAAWAAGKRLAAPRVDWENLHLRPIEIRSLASLEDDGSGIRQPPGSHDVPLAEIDLVIVPGIAFDRAGHRLGRGGGYYDRFLAQSQVRATLCGLAFEEQTVPMVPVEPHDMRLDMLVTEAGVWRFPRPPGESAAAAGGD